MLPPLHTSAILRPESRSPSFSAAANGAAPAGSIRLRLSSSSLSVGRSQVVVADEHEIVEMSFEDALR
jgi:hypothetical protein